MTTPIVECKDLSYIIETVCRLDKLQKEVILDSTNTCVSCNSSLLTAAYNTIPVSFCYRSGTRVTGISSLSGGLATTTEFFRIESIRHQRYVTLRLLVLDSTGTLAPTSNTMILDLDTVACIQCFSPISITLCNEQA